MGTDQSGVKTSTYLGVDSLVTTASDDWALLHELCELASASEGPSREAAKTLRRESNCVDPTFTQWQLIDWEKIWRPTCAVERGEAVGHHDTEFEPLFHWSV